MPRKPKNAAAPAASPAQPTPIAQDLIDKVSALKQLVTINALLHTGTFQVTEHLAIQGALKFVQSLHSQVMTDALKHDDAIKVPELREYMQNVAKQINAQAEAKEGKTNE